MTDFRRNDPPKSDPAEAASQFTRLWVETAKCATDLAHAKRTLFLAYVAEGFNEVQALDLVRSI